MAGLVASGGSQNFLGARWVALTVRHAPARWQRHVALRFLALSPHYFYADDREAETDRNRRSRAKLVDDLLTAFLRSDMRVIDYGCGPGYWANAVASRVATVEAVDISIGVLACADILNGALNITYETPAECAQRTETADLAYSFAVVQHMSDATLIGVLATLRDRLRPNGTLLIHFALPGNGWRTEQEWRDDSTLRGRVKLRVGLNCFGRTADKMTQLLHQAGFRDVRIEALAERTKVDDDIARQHWAIAQC